MGTGSSAENVMLSVPMPPTAWALASVWTSVWDAPRFRCADHLALDRETLAPLLKLAASCAAAILPELAVQDRKSQLPPFGASRDLLELAVDGDPAGAALSAPAADPVAWMRTLVRLCFQTGDGEYREGLDEEQLDRLISDRCATQLEQAACLTRDPAASLRSALAEVQKTAGELAARPFEMYDLAGTAQRLDIARRLMRVAEDAKIVLAEGVEKQHQSEKATDSTPVGAAGTPTKGGASAVDRATPMATDDPEVVECTPKRAEAEEEKDEVEEETLPLPKRTKSQVVSQLKVEKVAKKAKEYTDRIHDIQRTTSMLSASEGETSGRHQSLNEALQALEQTQKSARNFGEDLLEDMLALDGISGLVDEDRSTRKEALGSIEALLEELDTSKSRLARLRRNVEAKIEEEEKRKAAEQPAAVEVEPPPPVAMPLSSESSGKTASAATLEPRIPDRAIWQQIRLPLRFHSTEEHDCYAILATVPGLDTNELKIELADDSSTITVSGLRAPTVQEESSMRERIRLRMRMQSPAKLQKLISGGQVEKVMADAYIELGQGKYGLFSESFRVPEDVDVDSIDASYRDGVLRVVLPRQLRRTTGLGQGNPYGTDSWIPPSRRGPYGTPYGYAGQPDTGSFPRGRPYGFGAATPRGRGQLFGGHDDSLFW